MVKLFFNFFGASLFFLSLFSCTMDVKLHDPTNVFLDWCNSTGEMQGAKLHCDSSKYTNTDTYNRSLIVFVETGTLEANRSIPGSPFAGLLQNKDMQAIAPHVRMLMTNITQAYLENMQQAYKSYDAMYIISGDGAQKQKFFDALKSAAQHSNEVDLFMMVHGSPGRIYMNANLSDSEDTLTSDDIVQFANNELGALRTKIKNVFLTACYAAAGGESSITRAFVKAHPGINIYGSQGINYFPIHRDFVIFEEFQKSRNFQASVNLGNYAVGYNTYTQAKRDMIVYPSILGRGCVDLFLTTKCKDQYIPLGWSLVNSDMIYNSYATVEPAATPAPEAPAAAAPPPIAEQPATTVAAAAPNLKNRPTGWVDGFDANGVLHGWACLNGNEDQVYVVISHSSYSPNNMIVSVKADQPAEPQVAEACADSTQTAHRFSYKNNGSSLVGKRAFVSMLDLKNYYQTLSMTEVHLESSAALYFPEIAVVPSAQQNNQGFPTPTLPTAMTNRNAFGKIEAENFDSQNGLQVVPNALGYTNVGDYAVYHSVQFGAGAQSMSFSVGVPATGAGRTIKVHLGGTSGEMIAELSVQSTGSYENFQEQSINLNRTVTGTHSIVLVMNGNDFADIDGFSFSANQVNISSVAQSSVVPSNFTTTTSPQNTGAVVQSGQTYRIKNQCDSKTALTAQNSIDGSDIALTPVSSNSNQLFVVSSDSMGGYKLENVMSRKAIDVNISTASVAMGKIIQWSFWGGGNQSFKLNRQNDGSYQIQTFNRMNIQAGLSGVFQNTASSQCDQNFIFEKMN